MNIGKVTRVETAYGKDQGRVVALHKPRKGRKMDMFTCFKRVAGMAVTLTAGALINGAGITYLPSDAAAEVSLIVKLVAGNLVGSLFTLVVLAAVASYLPARRASRRNIVGALSHV